MARRIKKTCPTCDGVGGVSLGCGMLMTCTCPRCNGRGYIYLEPSKKQSRKDVKRGS